MERWVRILIVIVSIFNLAGCAEIGEKDKKGLGKREEIVLWSYYETEKQQIALDELTEGFNQSQEKFNLTWQYHGPATEFNKKLAIGITQEQLPDMVIIDNPDMSKYIEMDRFEDITESVIKMVDIDDYFPNVIESVKYKERYYGLPFCCNNVALIYNKDILEEEGKKAPANWKELEETAIALSTPERQGFAMCAINGEQGAFQLATLILSGGDELDEAGGEGTKKAFELVQTLVKNGALSKECINWSQNDVARVFISGECAMMENGPWVFPALEAAGINYGVVQFPKGERYKGVTGGENLSVLKGKNIEGSVEFMKYYNQREVMLNVNLRANSLPPRQTEAKLFLAAKPEYQIIKEQMKDCVSRSTYPKWGQLSKALAEAQYRIITEENTSQEACDFIKQQIK